MMLINGQEQNRVDASDRGLAYGDGLFETIEFKDGHLVYWDEHMHRLTSGCKQLQIKAIDVSILADECLRCTQGHTSGIIKIIVTRGSGARGYRPHANANTTRVISFHSKPDYPARYYSEGISLTRCATPVSINPYLAGLKSLSRLDQVMAQMEWSDQDYAEGLMLSPDENVIEGTKSNMFMVRNGELLTPSLEMCGIEGIMRQQVLRLAQESDLPVQICNIKHEDFIQADEIFVCNSLIKIWPVSHYLNRSYPIGPVTSMILKKLI